MFPTLKLVALLATSQVVASADSWCPAWFDDLAPRWMEAAPEIPGFQWSMWSPKCGNLHCKGVWNSPNFTDHPPLVIETPSRVASVTKPFTALAVLKLVEEGVIDVNASVFNYLPDWGIAVLEKQVGEQAHEITPWMLLHHTAGIGNPSWNKWLGYASTQLDREISLPETLEWFAENAPAVGLPGHGFAYSNTGYIYLGLLIEHVSNSTMAAAVREAAQMERLGMSSTYWEIYEDHPSGIPPKGRHYLGDFDGTDVNGSWLNYGGTGLVSSAEDLIKFARTFHRGCLLGKEGMDMVYNIVPTTGQLGDGDGYGCGWAYENLFGYDAWTHRGGFGGWIYYLPELDLAIAGTMNQSERQLSILDYMNEVLELVLAEGKCI